MDTHMRLSRRDALKWGAMTAAATGLVLAGCGTSTSAASNGPVTLNVWRWGSDGDLPKVRDTVVGLYPNLKNTQIKVTVPGANDFDVANAFRLALASHKNLPDIVMFNRAQIAEFASAGALTALDSSLGSTKSDFYAGALQVASYGGKVVGFPLEVKSKLFFYRSDLFDKAGISLSDLNTVDGFIAAGQKYHAANTGSYMLNLGPKPQQYWIGEILSAYNGVEFADKSGNYQLTSNPAFTDLFNFMNRVYTSGIAAKVDDFTNDWGPAFLNNGIGGVLIGNWMKFFLPGYTFPANAATSPQAGKWKVANWPQLAPLMDQSMGSEGGGSLMVVPDGAPNKDRAIDFLMHWVGDRQGSTAVYKGGGKSAFTPLLQSAKGDVLDFTASGTKPAGVTDAAWAQEPQNFFGSSYQQAEFDSFNNVRVFDYDPSATKEITILLQALENVFAGQSNVASALQQAQADMKSQIGNPYNV